MTWPVGTAVRAELDALHAESAALRAERDELQRKVEELRNALACEMDDTRNACAAVNAECDRLRSRLAEAERDAARLKERLEEATDLLGFAEARLLAFGQHNSTNPDYVLAMDAMKLFLLTADSAAMEGGE